MNQISWTGSSEKDHKIWFAVDKSDGASMGAQLFGYKTTGSFRTSSTKGVYYKLRAKREHIGNLTTRVSGTWTP